MRAWVLSKEVIIKGNNVTSHLPSNSGIPRYLLLFLMFVLLLYLYFSILLFTFPNAPGNKRKRPQYCEILSNCGFSKHHRNKLLIRQSWVYCLPRQGEQYLDKVLVVSWRERAKWDNWIEFEVWFKMDLPMQEPGLYWAGS